MANSRQKDDSPLLGTEPNISSAIAAEELVPFLTEADSGFALFTLDANGFVKTWTPGAEAVFGWSSAEAMGKSFEAMFTPEDVAAGAPAAELAQAAAEGEAPDVRWHLRKDGGRVFIRGATHRLLDKAGQVCGFLKAGRNLTGQYEAEEALKHTREQHRLILENVRDVALFLLDAQGRVSGWHVGLQRLTGYSEQEILGRPFRILYPASEQDSGEPDRALARARADGSWESEGWRVAKNGARLWVHEVLTAVTDGQNGSTGFVVIARDITKHRLAQREMLERERENALLAERTRMSQELHDTLAQGFTGIRLQIELAEETLRADPPAVDSSIRHLGRALDFAKQCQQESRHAIRALRSPLFDDLTLGDALGYLVQQLRGSAAIEFRDSGPPLRLPPDAQKDVFRIAQEALTNAIRHSHASHIVLALARLQGQTCLSITDDGTGLGNAAEGAGFGLLGMRERAERLGACLDIQQPDEGGTRVVLSWNEGHWRSP